MDAPSKLKLTLGDRLRQYRRAARLTQEQLAERSGMSVRAISDLERGARQAPHRDTLRLLTEALNLSADEAAALEAAVARLRGDASGGNTPVSSVPSVFTTDMASQPLSPAAEAPDAASSARSNPAPPPSGTVTFLFTDIEGSTRLLQRLGSAYADVLGEHQRLLRAAFAAHSGYEVDTQGDSFFVAFPTAVDALAAAAEATRALADHPWPEDVTLRVRMGLHSGAPQLVGDDYVGLDVHRAARIAASGHGGQILLSAAAAELARHNLPEGVTLRDLGAHRLKDLQQAERMYQAVLADAPGMLHLPADFPPLKALDARPHNLPVQPSLILGREREIEAVSALLRRDDVRLVTLTGAGGVGKTRLAVQVAAEALDVFSEGVWHVRLSRLTDPALVIPTIATTLELKESGATPLAEVLRGYLRDKHLLLVLDNFEQVAEAALGVADLLGSSPGVKALVTSRVALHLRGEREYALRPLELPDLAHLPPLERLSQYAAVALFIERAQAAQADFAVTNATAPAVAEICARLDGLPLAIELAAARVKLLPPPALLKRLERALPVLTGGARDLDERQQTMRNTLAWSYDLLAPEEQRLFRRLAVFVGGCTLEAAEAVCVAPDGAEPLRLDLLDGLSALVDHSLVQQHAESAERQRGEPRFGILYVIREFALEQLEVGDESGALRRTHAQYYVALAERAEPELVRSDARKWLDLLEREHDNVRAALGWAQHQREARIGLRLASALGFFWWKCGHLAEGRAWLDGLLELAQHVTHDMLPISEQAKALLKAGTLAMWGADYDAAWYPLEYSVLLTKQHGNLGAAADALNELALVAFCRHESERALALHEESLALARQSGDVRLVGQVLMDQGYIAYHLGDLETAQARAEESLAISLEVGDQHTETVAVMCLGEIARRRGDLDRAVAHLQHALRLGQRVRDPRVWAETLEYLAMTLVGSGRGQDAARLLGVASKVRALIGFPQPTPEEAATDVAVAPMRAALGDEAWQAAFTAGQALTLEEAIAEALGEAE